MYGRNLNGEVLEFGHAGILYRNSFVMYDRGSESLWLHVTGEALKGPLKGAQLEFLASEVVAWGDWRERYPETRVLLGRQAGGFMGSFSLRESMDEYGLSVGQGRAVTLFRLAPLEEQEILNETMNGQPIVVVFNPETAFAAAYLAELAGEPVRFATLDAEAEKRLQFSQELAPAGQFMRDLGTGTLWDRTQGTALVGPLSGQRLLRVPATPWLEERWLGFFPEGRIVGKSH